MRLFKIIIAIAAIVLSITSAFAQAGGVMSPSAPVAGTGGPILIGSGAAATAAGAPQNFTGTWSLAMIDTVQRRLNLSLFQNAGAVMGYGTLAAAGAASSVTAAGTASGNALEIFVVPVGGLEVYAMSLAPAGTGLSGRYTAYTAGGAIWSGTVSANLSAGAVLIPAPATAGAPAAAGGVGAPVTAGAGVGAGVTGTGIAGGPITSVGPTGITVGRTGVPPVIPPGVVPLFGERRTVSKSYSTVSDGTTTTTTGNTGNGAVTTSPGGTTTVSPDGTVTTTFG